MLPHSTWQRQFSPESEDELEECQLTPKLLLGTQPWTLMWSLMQQTTESWAEHFLPCCNRSHVFILDRLNVAENISLLLVPCTFLMDLLMVAVILDAFVTVSSVWRLKVFLYQDSCPNILSYSLGQWVSPRPERQWISFLCPAIITASVFRDASVSPSSRGMCLITLVMVSFVRSTSIRPKLQRKT